MAPYGTIQNTAYRSKLEVLWYEEHCRFFHQLQYFPDLKFHGWVYLKAPHKQILLCIRNMSIKQKYTGTWCNKLILLWLGTEGIIDNMVEVLLLSSCSIRRSSVDTQVYTLRRNILRNRYRYKKEGKRFRHLHNWIHLTRC